MKVSDLIHGRISTVELERCYGQPFPENMPALSEIALQQGVDAEWLLRVNGEIWPVQGVGAKDTDVLRDLRSGALHRLCWLVQKSPGKGRPVRLTMQVHEFVGAHIWEEAVQLGIDERIVDDMRRHRRQLNSVESLVKWLAEEILVHPAEVGGPVRALLSGTPLTPGERNVAFRLYGRRSAVDVATDTDGRLRVVRVVSVKRAREGDEALPIYLLTGDIGFCDVTLAGEFRGQAQEELAARTRQRDSYLRLWQLYNSLEREGLRDRAHKLGWLRYEGCKQLADGAWRFELVADTKANVLRALVGEDADVQIEAGEEIPVMLLAQPESDEDEQKWRRQKPFVGRPRLTGFQHRIDLRPSREQEDRTPPKAGYLFVSLRGDETRIERRERAWNAVHAGTCPLPQLGLIIEGVPVPVRPARIRNSFTCEVQAILPNPTDRQRMALDVALNTPDIALIQGPPGTGKTKVIAALLARLADKDEVQDGGGFAGNTLLTSFQHDAVENAAAVTRVLGLPAIKIGYRKGTEEGGEWLDHWSRETAEKVRAARAERGEEHSIHRVLELIRRLVLRHVETPAARDESLKLLRHVRKLGAEWILSELKDRLDHQLALLAAPAGQLSLADEDRADALKAVRSLRSDAVPFSDDGPAAAHRVLRRLRCLDGFPLTEPEQATLERAAAHDPDQPAPAELLEGIARLRDALVDRLQASERTEPANGIHADVVDLCGEVVDALNRRARELPSGIDMAVQGWLEALEHDKEGIRDTIGHYTMVLAATCQQSVSKAMTEAKSGEEMIFRSVIVDEAARANPLDLLIPMAVAERRIILVGDHRQLPQLLEPDVERQLRNSDEANMQDALERSLFERLFRQLRERENADGHRRIVTLDTQFRMHPVLGDFVSEQFYAEHGEGFSSGKEAVQFHHAVTLSDGTDLTGKVAAWVHLPNELESESGIRSKQRPVEVKRVVREAQAILKGDPDLSVGVISFYAAQRDAILEAMADGGLSELHEEDGYRIRDEWARARDGRERLRVGTVDAFQGKEFDVVLLSLTRSNRIEVRDEESRRKCYGFLLLVNRLCVAMSRQQRLLVVVGDLEMAHGEEARQSVPALAAFAQLCEEGVHGRVVRT